MKSHITWLFTKGVVYWWREALTLTNRYSKRGDLCPQGREYNTFGMQGTHICFKIAEEVTVKHYAISITYLLIHIPLTFIFFITGLFATHLGLKQKNSYAFDFQLNICWLELISLLMSSQVLPFMSECQSSLELILLCVVKNQIKTQIIEFNFTDKRTCIYFIRQVLGFNVRTL